MTEKNDFPTHAYIAALHNGFAMVDPLLEIHNTLGFIKKVLYGVLVLLGSLIILNIFNLLYLLTNG